MLSQATGILQANPLLGQALSAATGMPASLFGGAPAPAGGVEASGGLFTQPAPAEQVKAVPLWVWIAAGAAALVGVFLIFRKKA